MVAFQQREVVMRHVLRAPVSSEHPLASRSMPKSLELSEPARNLVPTAERLDHQPSLTLANERVSYSWQAMRRFKLGYRLSGRGG